jgi:hypothetical protein
MIHLNYLGVYHSTHVALTVFKIASIRYNPIMLMIYLVNTVVMKHVQYFLSFGKLVKLSLYIYL